MTPERLEWHLENWRDSMRPDTNLKRLSYPSKSLCFESGGDSANDEFEIMCEAADKVSAKAIDSIIDSLSKPQHTAVYFHWRLQLFSWPTQDLDYEEAKESIMRIAERRGLF